MPAFVAFLDRIKCSGVIRLIPKRDIRANSLQFADNILITALNVVDMVDLGHAVRHKPGNDKSRTCAKVARGDRCAMQMRYTGKYRVLIDWKKKELIWNQPCPAQAANEDWNEVSRHLAYTLNNNLYVMTNDGQTRRKGLCPDYRPTL